MENSAISYKCPGCGGELVFDPQKQLFSCPWCLSEYTDSQVDEGQHTEQAREEDFSKDTDVYKCNSCGAEIICDHNTAASFCYYCHNPVTLQGRLSGSYRPDRLIPFKLNRDLAISAFKNYCSKKWFLPSGFRSESQLEKITGLYVPFWLADCDVDAKLVAEGRIVSRYETPHEIVEHIRIFDLERAARMQYLGVPADASQKLEDRLMDAIEPFDYSELIDFDMKYLSGFYCDKYDVSKEDVLPRIKNRISKDAEHMLLSSISGYSSVTAKRSELNVLSTKWHYMLLPVWFMTYKHNGKTYSYALNGQTGKIAGKYPVSVPKAAAFTLAVCAAVALLFIGVGVFI